MSVRSATLLTRLKAGNPNTKSSTADRTIIGSAMTATNEWIGATSPTYRTRGTADSVREPHVRVATASWGLRQAGPRPPKPGRAHASLCGVTRLPCVGSHAFPVWGRSARAGGCVTVTCHPSSSGEVLPQSGPIGASMRATTNEEPNMTACITGTRTRWAYFAKADASRWLFTRHVCRARSTVQLHTSRPQTSHTLHTHVTHLVGAKEESRGREIDRRRPAEASPRELRPAAAAVAAAAQVAVAAAAAAIAAASLHDRNAVDTAAAAVIRLLARLTRWW